MSSNAVNSFCNSGLDPLLSLTQDMEIKGSFIVSQNQFDSSLYNIGGVENQGTSSSSHLLQYPFDTTLMEPVRKLPCFNNGSFSELISSFEFPDYPLEEGASEQALMGSRIGLIHGEICQGIGLPSPDGKKRKRVPEMHSDLEREEERQQKDVSRENLQGVKEKENKHKSEQIPGSNSRSKVMGKQVKDHSQSGEAPKEDYIHVRARRGMATNSHSLAERVRREKISERMRFLQDLVPGCSKITGKAVMLDEIINYVQSLQRQVEFLSMKLSTVNPELNIDIEQLLFKEILHSRAGSSTILGLDSGMSTSNPHLHTIPQGNIPSFLNSNPCVPTMSQVLNVWNNELQSTMQMGFISNPDLDILKPNGGRKMEL